MDVKVRAEIVNGAVEWTIDGKKPHHSVIELQNKSGKHGLDFHLIDETRRGFGFVTADPIWVHVNEAGQCPPQGIATDQISVTSCQPKKLSIDDKNSGDPCTLHYQLNFVDSEGNGSAVDPAIKNGGST